jgi:protein SCO1
MTPHFDAATREETIAAFVGAEISSDVLIPLLREQHPLYAGRSANETTRIRGFTLAALERTGVPEDALAYVLEELQSGHDPYLVAAAARALRGRAADPRFVPYLLRALENIRYKDAPVTFDSYKPSWPVGNTTTAANEIHKTLQWIGQSDEVCCDFDFGPDRSRRNAALRVEFQDQEGRDVEFEEFFHGKWSIVAFFYSRCDNPQKCSSTIAELAHLQQAIEEGSLGGRVRIAAITYDPAYDFPSRMRSFGENRGIRFGDDVRFLRTVSGFDDIRAHFDLSVNFIGSLVNRHSIEMYILDECANIVAAFTRMQWSAASIVGELERLTSRPRREWVLSMVSLPAIVLALLPKCPLCIGAYLTAMGLGGLQVLANRLWTIPIAVVLLSLHVWLVYKRWRQTANAMAMGLSLTGAAILLASVTAASPSPVAFAGAVLLAVAAIVGSRTQARAATMR